MSVLKGLLEKRDAASEELEGILRDADTGEERTELTEEQESRSKDLLGEIDALDERIKDEKKVAKRQRNIAEARAIVNESAEARSDDGATVQASVENESRVYGEGSDHSFYVDQIHVHTRTPLDPRRQAAEARLTTWSHQVERDLINAPSKEARRIEGEIREFHRDGGDPRVAVVESRNRGRASLEEKRSLASGSGATASSSGGGGASFVTPVFYVNDYAPYREFGRAFADQCNKQPLPDYGMNVYVPQVTAKAGVATQTEGNAVNESDPTFGYLSAALITKAGEVTVSQQLLDRAGPNFSFDRMIFDQLQRDYAPQVDSYVVTQAQAGATTQTWTGNSNAFDLTTTSGSGGFYGQVSKAKANIRTTNGTVLNPTHLFLVPARWEFIAAWADSTGRSIVVPDYAGPYNAAAAGSSDGDVGIEGNTGYRLNGLRVFTDNNIPNVTTTGADTAIVGDLNEVWVFEGTPVTRVLPQTLGSNLQTILQLYSYLAVLVRYPAGVVDIAGSGMASISYTN